MASSSAFRLGGAEEEEGGLGVGTSWTIDEVARFFAPEDGEGEEGAGLFFPFSLASGTSISHVVSKVGGIPLAPCRDWEVEYSFSIHNGDVSITRDNTDRIAARGILLDHLVTNRLDPILLVGVGRDMRLPSFLDDSAFAI